MRGGLNRAILAIVLAVLAVGLGLAALETGARAAGREEPVLALGDEAIWTELVDWSPDAWLRIVCFAALALVGLALVVWQVWPTRPEPVIEVASGPSGRVTLPVRVLASTLADRLGSEGWVERPNLGLRMHEGAARVRSRPTAGRPVGPDEVADARAGLAKILAASGVTAFELEVSPRLGRNARRVR